jgi:hypothetical protein
MTIYSAGTEDISPAMIIAYGIVAFVASMLEVVLDLLFPPHELRNN